ncbi:MAG: hypothetical protein U0236_16880 [Nitrospira sp.]
MKQIAPRGMRFSWQGIGTLCLVVCLCLGVVVQMLGVPVTLLALLTSDSPSESLSEDFSILPILLTPRSPNRSAFHVEFQRFIYLPIFLAAIFRPPQG